MVSWIEAATGLFQVGQRNAFANLRRELRMISTPEPVYLIVPINQCLDFGVRFSLLV